MTASDDVDSPRRPRRPSTERREDVLAAARSEFVKSGYAGATVREIAAAADVNDAMLCRFFPTKEQLFEEAIAGPLEEAITNAFRPAPGDAEVREVSEDVGDAQDVEFTIESGRLWLLQARVAKRSPEAAVTLAVLFRREGLISREEALDRVRPEDVDMMLRPRIDPHTRAQAKVLARGRPASPGIASGTLVTDVDEAEQRASVGETIVLARPTTTPDDVVAMTMVAGIITEIGGTTSHAAVVSRELGVACIVGCGEGQLMGLDGSDVTMDANTGEVLEDALAVVPGVVSDDPDLDELTRWAREESGDQSDASLPALLRARMQRRERATGASSGAHGSRSAS